MSGASIDPGTGAGGRLGRLRRDLIPLYALAAAIVCGAGGWYLLKELATLLRPLVLSIFLAYLLLPMLESLRRRFPASLSGPLLAFIVAVLVLGLAQMVYSNLVNLNADLPRLLERARTIVDHSREWGRAHLPSWFIESSSEASRTEVEYSQRLRLLASGLLNAAAGFLGEAIIVGFYLIFLLMEVSRLPIRIRASFNGEQADRILTVFGSINVAMASYLRAKVLASLINAVPVVLVLWAFGVPFAGMWGVLTFIANFIPYVGTPAALLPPAAFAFLELEPIWRPMMVLILLMTIQFIANNFIEPVLTARAVDLSAFVVLVSLSFWGLCWGIVGMILAIPLTVMLKIVSQNVAITRPIARLISEE